MNLIEALNWRYATKKMNGTSVAQEKIDFILEAIRLAPTSMGLQPFQVMVITDQKVKEEIAPIANNQSQIIDSSHLLVFTAWNKITEERVNEYIERTAKTRNLELAALDPMKNTLMKHVGLSAEQNFTWTSRQAYITFGIALAAAAEQQVDATPMEGFNNAQLDQYLNLEEKGLKSVTMLPLGYRDVEKDWLAPMPKVRREKADLFI